MRRNKLNSWTVYLSTADFILIKITNQTLIGQSSSAELHCAQCITRSLSQFTTVKDWLTSDQPTNRPTQQRVRDLFSFVFKFLKGCVCHFLSHWIDPEKMCLHSFFVIIAWNMNSWWRDIDPKRIYEKIYAKIYEKKLNFQRKKEAF